LYSSWQRHSKRVLLSELLCLVLFSQFFFYLVTDYKSCSHLFHFPLPRHLISTFRHGHRSEASLSSRLDVSAAALSTPSLYRLCTKGSRPDYRRWDPICGRQFTGHARCDGCVFESVAGNTNREYRGCIFRQGSVFCIHCELPPFGRWRDS